MAKTSMKVKAHRPAKFSSRAYTRCERCGRQLVKERGKNNEYDRSYC